MSIKTAAEIFGNGAGVPGDPGWVPIDLSSPPTYSAANRGLAFGEQVTSAVKNRTTYALALNDEDLDARINVFSTSAGAAAVGVDPAGFAAVAVTTTGLGGLGAPVEIQTALQAANDGLVKRRAFTAVLTDGTDSTGGDYDGADAVEVLSLANLDFGGGVGTFFVRRGTNYRFPASVPTIMAGYSRVVGETHGGSGVVTQLLTPATYAGALLFNGHWENLTLGLGAGSPTSRWETTTGGTILERCQIEAGGFRHQGQLLARGCNFVSIGGTADSDSTVRCRTDAQGVYDGCTFAAPVAASTLAEACLLLTTLTSGSGLVFRNCTFEGREVNPVPALLVDGCSVPILFENCRFTHTGDPGIPLITITDSYNVLFRSCSFESETDGLLYVDATSDAAFDDCYFQTGSTVPAVRTRGILVGGATAVNALRVPSFRNCRMSIGPASLDSANLSTLPIASIGGTGPVHVDGFRFEFTSGALSPAVHFYFNGPADTRRKSIMSDITIDYNGLTYTTDPASTYSQMVDISGGGYVAGASLVLRNINIININGSPGLDCDVPIVRTFSADVDGLVVHYQAGVGGFDFTEPVIILGPGTYRGVRILGGADLRCSSYTWISAFGSSEEPVIIDGLSIDEPHPTVYPSSNYIQIGDSVLLNHLTLYAWNPPAAFAAGSEIIQIGDRCRLVAAFVRCDYDPAISVVNLQGNRGQVRGCDISILTPGATVRSPIRVLAGADNCIIDGNVVTNTGAGTGVPTISDSGVATIIGDNSLSLD